jgi:predicted ATPase/class 3 adenylate cyclase
MAEGVTAPSGTVTFLFTDIEGSTQLWEADPDAMREAVERHDRILRAAIEGAGGYVFTTAGDAFAAAFSRVGSALDAAATAQRSLREARWTTTTPLRVRMGIHTGEANERDGDYFGSNVNRAARIMSAAHGGQVVLSAAAAALAGGAELRDLGEHLLRDLSGSEHLWQLVIDGTGEFPPLRTLSARRNNLPVQRTALLGRRTELDRVATLIAARRMVTLTGVGGTGKTRLALAAAAEAIERFDDGVCFVDLSPITDDDLVAQAVADAVGLKVPVHATSQMVHRVATELGERSILLVLDNCEHVLDAAATLVDGLLDGGHRVRVLATSREALDVAGEQVVHVLPLAWSTEGDDRGGPAVELLVERATEAGADPAALDDIATLRELCRQVDGIPLAIELIAVQLRHVPPASLLERLDDRFRVLVGGRRGRLERQRTLAAMMDWSWELLATHQRRVLADASVFAGGFTAQAVGAVTGSDELDASRVIGELVAKSLVLPAGDRWGARYRLLDTVRLYGLQRLDAEGRTAAVRDAHARWLADWCDRAPFDVQWLSARHAASMRREFDNVRAALDWLGPDGDASARARIIRSCSYLFREDFFRDEALRWTTSDDWADLAAVDRARMLLVGAEARFVNLDYEGMRAAGYRAYELAVEAGDDAIAAAGLMISCEGLANAEPDVAGPRIRESIERSRRANAPRIEAVCLTMLLIGSDAHRWPDGSRDVVDRMTHLAGPDGLDHESAVRAASGLDLADGDPRAAHRRLVGLVDESMELGLNTSSARLALSAACIAARIPDEELFARDVQLAADEFHRAGVHRAAADLVMVIGYWDAWNDDPRRAARLLATARRQPLFDMNSYGWWAEARDRVRRSADPADLVDARRRGELDDVAATLASESEARGIIPRAFRSLTPEEMTPGR